MPTEEPTVPDSAELHERMRDAVGAMYAATADLAGLSAAIDVLEQGLQQLAADHPHRGLFLAALGDAFGFRFGLSNVLGDLVSAIAVGEQAIAVMPTDDPRRGLALGKLAESYILRFEAAGDPSALDAAIAHCERALAEAPATTAMLAPLAYAHQHRSDTHGDPADVDAQIRHAEHGLALADLEDFHRPLLHELVAAGHERRYDLTGAIGDLDAAVTCREAAVAGGWRDDHMQARNLSNLSLDYLDRHSTTGNPADVHNAIDHGSTALAITGTDSADRAELQYKLGLVYQARFMLAGDLADLHEYVRLAEESRRCAPADYEVTALSNLAGAYAERYEHAGNYRDLDAGIEIGEEALAHPRLTRQQRGSCRAILAVIYRTRFQHFGAQADLDYAIQLGRRAIRAFPDGHPELAKQLGSLAVSYAERFDRYQERADLDTAVELCERALATPGISHAERWLLQFSLGSHLLRRFQAEGDPADLDASAEQSTQALGATDESDARWPEFATLLAGALLHRHRLHTQPTQPLDRVNLDKAIDLIESAVAATRPDSPFYLGRLQNLAVAYQEEAVDSRRQAEVVKQLIDAVGTATETTPSTLASTMTNVGSLALQAGLLTEAAAMWRSAVELLPRCAPRGLTWTDQEHQLSGRGDLVGEATAAHLAIGEVAKAVELAELGRGILLFNQLDTRTDLAALARSAPELAAELEQLIAELDTRSHIAGPLHDLGAAPALRRPPHHLADRWDQLLHRIRALPGLSDFLAPPRIAELQGAATGGAIALVNVGTLGGDAVVLTSDSTVRVRLPNLVDADVDAQANALAGVEIYTEGSVQKAIATTPKGATHELLAWLWETITEPVLTALGHNAPPEAWQPMPRIWWVGTGKVSLLPLHAAGLPDGPSALDRVLSSYAPTIRALTIARQRRSPGTRTGLTVTMRHTDGLPDLPATALETTHLLAKHPDTAALTDSDATAAAVLDALPQASWAHFACHAISHPEGASKSGLQLHDRTLRVPEISRVSLRDGELAYLSACSTGQGSIFQADEAIHLASAFQLAGYRHVVATLWPVNDQVAAMAARRFYRLLGDSPNADHAAAALHDVTQRLRARYPGNPELWAPLFTAARDPALPATKPRDQLAQSIWLSGQPLVYGLESAAWRATSCQGASAGRFPRPP